MTHEEEVAIYILENPNCTWEEVKSKFNGKAQNEVFRVAKREIQKLRMKKIIHTLEKVFDSNDTWHSFDEFFKVCLNKGVPEIQKTTVRRFFNRMQNVRNIIHQ